MDPCQAIPVKPFEEVTAAAQLVEMHDLKSAADGNFAEIGSTKGSSTWSFIAFRSNRI